MNEPLDRYSSFIERALRYKMAELGLRNYQELARHYGISRRTIGTILKSGERAPSHRMTVEAMTDFCRALRAGETNGAE